MRYVLVTRLGGTGDLLMLEPTIEALYYKHAPCKVILRTYLDYAGVLDDHPLIDAVILDDNRYLTGFKRPGFHEVETDTLNFGAGTLKPDAKIIPMVKGDVLLHYDFQGVVEKYQHLHGVDAFAHHADIKLLRRTPSFGSYQTIPKDQDFKVTVQLRNHEHPDRNLSREDVPLKFFPQDKIKLLDTPLSMEHYLNEIKTADVFIGPDSSGIHIAHAAGVRNIIGIYSDEFPASMRAYPGVMGFQKSQKHALARASSVSQLTSRYPDFLNTGNACEWIRNLAIQNCHGKGIDVGADKWPLPGAIPATEATRGDAFKKAPFDFVFSSHCLEHIENWQQELKLWEASLYPGGTMFLYLPHPAMEYWRPGGPWCGPWHKWSPEPVTLVKWLMENTQLKVKEYSVYPDSYWSFYIVAQLGAK